MFAFWVQLTVLDGGADRLRIVPVILRLPGLAVYLISLGSLSNLLDLDDLGYELRELDYLV